MTSLLLGDLANIINDALGSSIFLDAVLTRDVVASGGDPADPPDPTQVTYTCKAIRDFYGAGFLSGGLVDSKDVKVIILQKSLSTTPLSLDRITITGMPGTFVIVSPGIGRLAAVTADPANATWECRATN